MEKNIQDRIRILLELTYRLNLKIKKSIFKTPLIIQLHHHVNQLK